MVISTSLQALLSIMIKIIFKIVLRGVVSVPETNRNFW